MDPGHIRIVRFSDEDNICILPVENKEEEFQTQPFIRPRIDPRKSAREAAYQLIPKGYGQLLTGTFGDPADDCQENINAFVAGVPDIDNARGLERYMSQDHKDERDQAREDVVEAVLCRQQHLRLEGLDDNERAEKLRSASRRQSRDARKFARRLGIADDLAAREEQDDDDRAARFVASTRHLVGPGNAKKAHRQPSTRQLDVGIRRMAATRNAKKASRQASIRKLNYSIRNLASSMHSNGSNRSLCSCSSASTSSSADSSSCSSLIHPSLAMSRSRDRDRAMKLPGRPSRATECAEIIQSALELVDSANEEDQSKEERTTTRPVALSA